MKIQSIVIYMLIVLLSAPFAMASSRQEPPEVWQAFAQKLDAGVLVQVRLKDGKKIKGYFIPSSPDTFRMRPKTRISVPIRDFQFSDIQSIDRQHEGWSPGRKVLTFVGAGAGVTLAVLAVVLAASYD